MVPTPTRGEMGITCDSGKEPAQMYEQLSLENKHKHLAVAGITMEEAK